MKVTVLGSSGSYASVDNPCTGFLIESAEAVVLFDCGPGTVGPLQAATSLHDITAIVLSHCHPDHWLELPVLRNVFTWFEPRTGIPVYGTAETARMDQSLHVHVADAPVPFDWNVIDRSSSLTIADQRWTFDVTDHPVETLAGRVAVDNAAALFTSDTGPNWNYDRFGESIDIVFGDASHLSSFEGQAIPHMSAREAAVCAASAKAKHLVLTHLIPGSDPEAHREEAVAAYGGPVDVALPGAVFEL